MLFHSARLARIFTPCFRKSVLFNSLKKQSSSGHVRLVSSQNRVRDAGIRIYTNAMAAMSPATMVSKCISYDPQEKLLTVEDKSYKLNKNLHVVAFGKAVIGMAKTIEDVCGDEIVSAVASLPKGIQAELKEAKKNYELLKPDTKFKVYEGDIEFLTNETSHQAALDIIQIAESLSEDDVLLVLMSGGGSSLLPAPIPPLTLKEKHEVLELLRHAGAGTNDINLVRKHLSLVKGGGLATKAYPAKVISLVLSNILDDNPFNVASAPTLEDTTTPQQAVYVLKKFGVYEQTPSAVLDVLQGEIKDVKSKKWLEGFNTDPDPRDWSNLKFKSDFSHVQNILVGSNLQVLNEAGKECERNGYLPLVIDSMIRCDSKDLGHKMALLGRYICEKMAAFKSISDGLLAAEMNCIRAGLSKMQIKELSLLIEKSLNTNKAICILSAGELTVGITGTGSGGQNMEFCLAAAIELNKLYNENPAMHTYDLQVLSVDTDGFDGSTDVAGAFSDCVQANSIFFGKTAEDFLKNNDSYSFYKSFSDERYLIRTGRTGFDIMDFQMLMVHRL